MTPGQRLLKAVKDNNASGIDDILVELSIPYRAYEKQPILSAEDVRSMRAMRGEDQKKWTINRLSEKFEVSKTVVWNVLNHGSPYDRIK